METVAGVENPAMTLANSCASKWKWTTWLASLVYTSERSGASWNTISTLWHIRLCWLSHRSYVPFATFMKQHISPPFHAPGTNGSTGFVNVVEAFWCAEATIVAVRVWKKRGAGVHSSFESDAWFHPETGLCPPDCPFNIPVKLRFVPAMLPFSSCETLTLLLPERNATQLWLSLAGACSMRLRFYVFNPKCLNVQNVLSLWNTAFDWIKASIMDTLSINPLTIVT